MIDDPLTTCCSLQGKRPPVAEERPERVFQVIEFGSCLVVGAIMATGQLLTASGTFLYHAVDQALHKGELLIEPDISGKLLYVIC